MRKLLLTLAALGMTTLPTLNNDVLACGDKFLVVGPGVRYQHIQASAHPASVLVFADPDSTNPSAVKDMQLQTALSLAGHAATVVKTEAELAEALKTGTYDIVLADLGSAALIGHIVASAPSQPIFLPVVYEATKEQLTAVRTEYGCLVKAPARSGYFLAAIDEALDVRHNAANLAKKQ